MQVMADVFNMPIQVAKSEQTPALGAAMLASVAAGVYPNVEAAKNAMGGGFDAEYTPIPANVEKYKPLYLTYSVFGEFIEKQTK